MPKININWLRKRLGTAGRERTEVIKIRQNGWVGSVLYAVAFPPGALAIVSSVREVRRCASCDLIPSPAPIFHVIVPYSTCNP